MLWFTNVANCSRFSVGLDFGHRVCNLIIWWFIIWIKAFKTWWYPDRKMEAVCKNRGRQWGLVWDASVDEAVLKGERSRTSLQITKKAMSSTRRRITPKGQLWWKEKHFSGSEAAADEKAHHLKEARRENFQRKRIEDLTRIKKDYLLPIPSWERAAWRQMFLLVGFKLQTHYKRASSEDLYFYYPWFKIERVYLRKSETNLLTWDWSLFSTINHLHMQQQ